MTNEEFLAESRALRGEIAESLEQTETRTLQALADAERRLVDRVKCLEDKMFGNGSGVLVAQALQGQAFESQKQSCNRRFDRLEEQGKTGVTRKWQIGIIIFTVLATTLANRLI
jgi:hypothetical protein